MARSKLLIASSCTPAILLTHPLQFHATNELGLSATARSAISISLSLSPRKYAEIKQAQANASGSLSSILSAKRESRTAEDGSIRLRGCRKKRSGALNEPF